MKYDGDWFKTHQVLAFGLINESGPHFVRRVVRVSGAPENVVEIDQYFTGEGVVTTDWSTAIYFIEVGKLFEKGANVDTILNEVVFLNN